MRTFFLFLTLFFFSSLQADTNSDETVTLEKPPASLAQWYKPQGKRNTWHHSMFKLRRGIQAVKEHTENKDQAHAEKWAVKLITTYKKLGTMVPEWQDELELDWADKLVNAAKDGDFTLLKRATKKLETSCKGCHSDYRAQVAAIYRAPNFKNSHVDIEGKKTSYLTFMKILMRDVNRIKIASDDGNKERAQLALVEVRKGIKTLRTSCDECHKDSEAKDYYLGKKAEKMMDEIEVAIDKGKSGRKLGEFAVHACARCHGSHRIVYDLRNEIE